MYYYSEKDKHTKPLFLIIPVCCFFHKLSCKNYNCYNQCIIDLSIYDESTSSKECKIDFKLFIKYGKVLQALYNNLLQNKPKYDKECFISHKECYCKCNDTFFKRVFGDVRFNDSQYSFKHYENNL